MVPPKEFSMAFVLSTGPSWEWVSTDFDPPLPKMGTYKYVPIVISRTYSIVYVVCVEAIFIRLWKPYSLLHPLGRLHFTKI